MLKTFKNAPGPPVYESNLIAKLIRDGIDIGISAEDLSEINLSYLENYCNNHNVINLQFRQLHTNAIRISSLSLGEPEIIPEGSNFI